MNITLPQPSLSSRAGDLQSPSGTLRNATGRRLQVAGTGATALLAAALLSAPPAFAQVKSEPKPVPAKPPAPAAVPVAPKVPSAPSPPAPTTSTTVPARPAPTKADVPARPASASPKLSVLEIPACALEEAVQHLQVALERSNMEPLNILFGPETKELGVSSLNLRNITGQDALHLIAAAANCTVETMTSKEAQGILVGYSPAENAVYAYPQKIIGYMFSAKPKPQSVAGAAPAMFTRIGSPPPATIPSGRLTRIYPLGAVTSRADARLGLDDVGNPKPSAWLFPDLEKTLREVLKTDGVAENQVTLAFHEKTNVLVVNSTEAVHLLVNQLLQALEQNVGQTAAFQRMMKLQADLADRDKELRELQRELRQLQNPAPKPPSAK